MFTRSVFMQLPRNLNGAAPQPSTNGVFKQDDAVTAAQSRQASEPAAGEAPVVDDQNPYQQVGFSAWRRTLQIYAFALTVAFRYWRLGKPGTYSKMPGGMSPENVSVKKAELAKWLREGLIRLGPTFIKIGQQFSTRVDVLSKEFISELELLQDKVLLDILAAFSLVAHPWSYVCILFSGCLHHCAPVTCANMLDCDASD
jgi:hypothetical protein